MLRQKKWDPRALNWGHGLLRTLPWALASTALGAVQPEDILVYSVGPLRVRPQLSASAVYDDNVFYRTSSQAKGDFYSVAAPGLELELGSESTRYQSLLDIDISNHAYAELDSLNHVDQQFALKGSLNLERFSLDASAGLSRNSGILGGSSVLNEVGGFSNLGTKVSRWVFRDDIRVDYVFSEKTGAYVLGHYDGIDYRGSLPLYDQNALRGTIGGGYQAFSKISLFAETYYGQISATPNFAVPKPPHLRQGGLSIGSKGDFTPRITGSVQVGYEVREFGDGTDVPGVPVVLTSLSYAISEKRALRLNYSRSTGVSVESGRAPFTTDSIGFELTQKIGTREKWMATLTGNYRTDAHDSTGGTLPRDDSYYSIGFRLSYQIQLWLSSALAYSRENYESSTPGAVDYHVNRMTLSISIGY